MRVLARGNSVRLARQLCRSVKAKRDSINRACARPCVIINADAALGAHAASVELVLHAANTMHWPVFMLSARDKTHASLRGLLAEVRERYGSAASCIRRCYLRPREYRDDTRAYRAAVREHIAEGFGHTVAIAVGDTWGDVCADPHASAHLPRDDACIALVPDGLRANGGARILFGLKV